MKLLLSEGLIGVFLQVVGQRRLQAVVGSAGEEVILFHRALEGADDGAGGGIAILDIDDEGTLETIVLEEGLVLGAPFAFEGTVLAVFPGPGADIDLPVVIDDRVGSGFREDEPGAFLVEVFVGVLVTGVLEPSGEVAARQFEIQEGNVVVG